MRDKTIVYQAFTIVCSFPKVNWQDCLLLLFDKSLCVDDAELSRSIFFRMVVEMLRTRETCWVEGLVDSSSENRYGLALKKLGLHYFALDVLETVPPFKDETEVPSKYWEQQYKFESSFWAQFREGSQYTLCACCFSYDLSCEEIQDFPLVNDEVYIRRCFDRALGQGGLHKRQFIVDYILNQYFRKTENMSLFLDLWFKSESMGIHTRPLSRKTPVFLLYKRYFKNVISILNFRHHSHDSLIDDLILILLERNKHNLASYLNAKMSTPKERLISAVSNVLIKKDYVVKDSYFMNNIAEAIKHEKWQKCNND